MLRERQLRSWQVPSMSTMLDSGDTSTDTRRGVPILLRLLLYRVQRVFRHRVLGYLMILPASLLLVSVLFYPLFSLIKMSFYSIEPLRHPGQVFCGFANYARLMGDPDLRGSLARTVFWTFGSVANQFIIGLVAALILNETFRGRGLARALLLVPWAMPSVVGAFAWKWMYHAQYGLLNHILNLC